MFCRTNGVNLHRSLAVPIAWGWGATAAPEHTAARTQRITGAMHHRQRDKAPTPTGAALTSGRGRLGKREDRLFRLSPVPDIPAQSGQHPPLGQEWGPGGAQVWLATWPPSCRNPGWRPSRSRSAQRSPNEIFTESWWGRRPVLPWTLCSWAPLPGGLEDTPPPGSPSPEVPSTPA